MSLLYAGQQFTIYVGFFVLIVGLVGDSMNIFIFASVRTYRTTPCTFYFLVGSIFDIAELLFNLISRIVSAGYGIDSTRTSIVWCKARNAFVTIFGIIPLTCASLAVIDNFLATSQSARLRRWSKIEWAHRIVIGVIIIWCLHGLLWIVYYDISPISHLCVYSNATFGAYLPIFIIVVLCAIPISVMIIFGCLAYRNIRQTTSLAEQHADRQLARMICMQVILVVISLSPYGIYDIYILRTAGITKDADRLDKELFAFTVVTLLCYINYAGSFYVFLVSSNRFRRTVKDRIFWWRTPNRIVPSQQS